MLTESAREDARRHIRDHALGEAARIERLSRVREVVLGVQDGLLVPLGVVTGTAAAAPGRSAILVAGIADAVAGCIAMGGGSYLASEAEEALYAAEIADEGREIDDEPEREVAELALVLELVVGLSYMLAAVIPLWPYLALPLTAPAITGG